MKDVKYYTENDLRDEYRERLLNGTLKVRNVDKNKLTYYKTKYCYTLKEREIKVFFKYKDKQIELI